MSTLVSKKVLAAGIGLFAIKNKSGRERTAEFAQASEGLGLALVAAYLEHPLTSDANLDLVAFFEFERVNHSRGQTHRQAIAPFGYLHGPSMIYIFIVYHGEYLRNSIRGCFVHELKWVCESQCREPSRLRADTEGPTPLKKKRRRPLA